MYYILRRVLGRLVTRGEQEILRVMVRLYRRDRGSYRNIGRCAGKLPDAQESGPEGARQAWESGEVRRGTGNSETAGKGENSGKPTECAKSSCREIHSISADELDVGRVR
jgi:hypothetical protein